MTVRRQSPMFGSFTPVQRSRNRITEVWSKTSEQTYPPTVHGDTTSIGTRMPRPVGLPSHCSSVTSGEATGGGTWSKKPSFSS